MERFSVGQSATHGYPSVIDFEVEVLRGCASRPVCASRATATILDHRVVSSGD